MKKNKNEINIMVVATMSSGKSTFINSLLGEEIMPTMNQACTAKITTISINNNANKCSALLSSNSGKYKRISNCNLKDVEYFNEDPQFDSMVIECSAWRVRNKRRTLLIHDTPGVNNASDNSHKKITEGFIQSMKSGLIIYVLNVSNIGVYDDYKLLKMVSSILKERKDIKILFVANKMDVINRNIEKPEAVMNNIKKYIESTGITNPRILPCSSDASFIFRKVIKNKHLTESEIDRFYSYFKLFNNKGYSLNNFAITNDELDMDKFIMIDDEPYRLAEILCAMGNTGINLVEQYIEEYIVKKK